MPLRGRLCRGANKRILLAAVAASLAGTAQAQVLPLGNPGVQVTASATGTTGAVVATLPAAVGKLTWVCGAYVTGNEAATGAVVNVTIANIVTGSMVIPISHPVTPNVGTLSLAFNPCIPGNAPNTAVTVTSAADAAGTNVAVAAWGYQR
jgi:hypothetical protein